MGLYDTFFLNKPIECPLCGAKENNALHNFQTKELGSNLFSFEQGKKAESFPFILMDGKYEIYGSCRFCNAWIDALAIVKDGIFIGIKEVEAETFEEKVKEYT